MSDSSSEEGIPIAKVVEMHLEGAKWLLAIMAGMLVYGLDRLTEHPIEGSPLFLFAASSFFLSVSAAAALTYLLKSFNYASSGAEILAARRKAAEIANADTRAGAQQVSEISDDGSAENAGRKKTHENIGLAYSVMIWTFSIGGSLYLLFGLQQILTIKDEPKTQLESSEQGLFVRQGGQIWVLRDGKNGPVWVRLPDAPKQ